jgi:hypothetical protein
MLNKNGSFVFDIFSYEGYIMTKSNTIEKKYVEVKDATIFWNEAYNEKTLTVSMDIYVKKQHNRFENYHEQHIQHMYNNEEINSLLKDKYNIIKEEDAGIRKIYYCAKK